MLEQYFLRPTNVDRIRSNWLGPQIEQYVEWMHAQKYGQRNITRRVALLCHFADFTRANAATDLASASSLVEKFGDRWMARNRCWNLENPALRPASIRALNEPFLGSVHVGSEYNGGRCNLDIGLGTGETTRRSQGLAQVPGTRHFAELKVSLCCEALRYLGLPEGS